MWCRHNYYTWSSHDTLALRSFWAGVNGGYFAAPLRSSGFAAWQRLNDVDPTLPWGETLTLF